ncbi:MAG: hypothetical protein JSS98_06835 [Bacteroidetes bacterium]|nr:hypothetical protein [Bacteroidota bacterium]
MRHILFSGFLSLIIFSCQKDKTPERRTENPQSDSTTLAMYVDLDTTKISGSDTLVVQKYSYDNLKRLSKSYYIEYDDGVPDGLYLTELFYNGNDTLPFKVIRTDYELPSGNLSSSNFNNVGYYYYEDGKLTSDSITSSSDPSIFYVTSYSYEKNAITTTYILTQSPPLISAVKYYQTKTNGNTTLQIDSSFVNGTFSGSPEMSLSASYDTKHNPFYHLLSSITNIPPEIYSIETYSEDMIVEKNNPIEIISGFHLKYIYEYNQDDYPTIARVYDIEEPVPFLYKRIFIYTKL